MIVVRVFKKSEPIEGVKVQTSWDSTSLKTDGDGFAIFPDVPRDVKNIFVDGKKISQTPNEDGEVLYILK